MSVRPVLRLGDPALRKQASNVPDGWLSFGRLQALINDLIDTKSARSGAGLAALQIGEHWRVVVGMGVNPRYPHAPLVPERVLMNPEITSLVTDTIAGWEGCLSLPRLRGEVKRWQRIHLIWRDLNGRCQHEDLEGFLARVVQPECDHLDGVLFPDRLRHETAFGFEDELRAAGLLP